MSRGDQRLLKSARVGGFTKPRYSASEQLFWPPVQLAISLIGQYQQFQRQWYSSKNSGASRLGRHHQIFSRDAGAVS